MSIRALQDYIFYSRYARHLPEKKRRETFRETVDRVFDMHRRKYVNELAQSEELRELISIAERALASKTILGSQRALQFGGEAILKKNERIYNCSSGHVDRPRAFQEALYLLLCGVGVGFSTQYCHVNKLPKVQKRVYRETVGAKKYVVEDSVEGWADAVGVLMSSFFVEDQPFPEYFGWHIEFDFSKIRPRGSLISWGGIAPGPEGLERALERIQGLINRRIESSDSGTVQLPPIDCYDILMHISDSVLSGGIRRSACINLFSPEDTEMAMAKTGDWFLTNPQRARSNNSALLIRNDVGRQQFADLFKQTREFGEPGFVWAEHENVSVNPCVTADTLVNVKVNGEERLVRMDVLVSLFISKKVTLEALSMNIETNVREWKTITNAAMTRADAEIVKIELCNGQFLKCTPDHKIWTTNRGYVEAKDLTEDDDVEIL